MADQPLKVLELTCASVAEHAGFVALNDVAIATKGKTSRIIGGHMISLHAHRWQLDLPRETSDADLGVPPAVVATPALIERIHSLGYDRIAGNRFAKPIHDLTASGADTPQAIIDVLVPTYKTRARTNHKFGEHLTTTEVRGLATALRRPAVNLDVNIVMLDGQTLEIPVCVPDELAALALKVLVRKVRTKDTDAFDVWRALEVCYLADIETFDVGADASEVRRILETEFAPGGTGTAAVCRLRSLSPDGAQQLTTRMQALIAHLLAKPKPITKTTSLVETPGGRTQT